METARSSKSYKVVHHNELAHPRESGVAVVKLLRPTRQLTRQRSSCRQLQQSRRHRDWQRASRKLLVTHLPPVSVTNFWKGSGNPSQKTPKRRATVWCTKLCVQSPWAIRVPQAAPANDVLPTHGHPQTSAAGGQAVKSSLFFLASAFPFALRVSLLVGPLLYCGPLRNLPTSHD